MILLCLLAGSAVAEIARPAHERAVVYGEREGVGLLLDVFRPAAADANGRGVLFMVSGGLKSNRKMLTGLAPMIEGLARRSGYTMFAVMHPSQPRWVVREIYPTTARAVRFIRYNARRFGVDPNRLGIMGFSSGAYLALMTATRGDDGVTTATDPVERVSSRVQAAVAFFHPTDFMNYGGPGRVDLGTGLLKSFRRAFFHYDRPRPGEEAIGPAISPITYVSADDPPILLIHGDADRLVPIQQSRRFLEAMRRVGAPCELRVRPGGGHGWWPDMPTWLDAAMEWFDMPNAERGIPNAERGTRNAE